MIGKEPARKIREEMRRFKQLMEAGEIPTIEGQSSGRAAEGAEDAEDENAEDVKGKS